MKGVDKKLKICFIPYAAYMPDDQITNENCWGYYLKRKLEKDGHSFELYTKNTIKDSDLILCMDNTYFSNVDFFREAHRHDKLNQMIHIEYEPPSANCRIHNKKGILLLSKLFKSLITYNDDLAGKNNLVKGVIGDFFQPELKYKNDFGKRKFLVAITNNTTTQLIYGKNKKIDNYYRRKKLIKFFNDTIPKDFDLYGQFWPEDYNAKGYVDRLKKYQTLAKYRFALSFDSCVNQRGYISEKIFDCFRAKVVPIYYGANNVTDYIPKECFVDYRDFRTDKELLSHLQSITKKEWEAKIGAIEKFLKSNKYKRTFSSDSSAEILYRELMKPARMIDKVTAKKVFAKLDRLAKKQRHLLENNPFLQDPDIQIDRTSQFTFEKIRGVWCLVFIIYSLSNNLGKRTEIVSNNRNVYRIKKIGKGYPGSFEYRFYVSYQEVFERKKIKLYSKDLQSGNLKDLFLVQSQYINMIHYNEENRIFAKNNVLGIRKHPFIIAKNRAKDILLLSRRVVNKLRRLI
jgi:hypothetical protein